MTISSNSDLQQDSLAELVKNYKKFTKRTGVLTVVSLVISALSLYASISALNAAKQTDDKLDDAAATITDITTEIQEDAKVIGQTTDALIGKAATLEHTTDTTLENTEAIEETTGIIKNTTDTTLENTEAIEETTGIIKNTTDTTLENTEAIEETTQTISITTGETSLRVNELRAELDDMIQTFAQYVEERFTELLPDIGADRTDPIVSEPSDDTSSPPPQPSIEVIGRNLGPTSRDGLPGGAIPCAKTSVNCRYLEVTMAGFNPGRYWLTCKHDGWDRYPAGTWGSYYIDISSSGTHIHEGPCYINFDKLTGQGVKVTAAKLDEVGTSIPGTATESPYTKEVS